MQMMILTHAESDAEHFNAAFHALEAWDIAQRMKIEHQVKEIQALHAQLATAKGKMIWTTQRPTKPGMYWYRRPSKHSITGWHVDTCWVRQLDVDNPKVAFTKDSEWSSEPIPEPKEPA